MENNEQISANTWWRSLSINEQKALLTKYDPLFNKMESHKVASPYNTKLYPDYDLIKKMNKNEAANTVLTVMEKFNVKVGDTVTVERFSKPNSDAKVHSVLIVVEVNESYCVGRFPFSKETIQFTINQVIELTSL